jgi:hypothetical protein
MEEGDVREFQILIEDFIVVLPTYVYPGIQYSLINLTGIAIRFGKIQDQSMIKLP